MILIIFIVNFCYENNENKNSQESKNSQNLEIQQVSNVIWVPNSKAKLDELKQINQDVEAWINIPGSAIDFPVMKWTSDNNSEKCFYDRKDEYKNYSFAGSIYSGNGIVFSPFEALSNNLILHGHNLDDNPNGKKFAQLVKFQNIEFAQKTPYIFITTPDNQLIYEIYAVFFTDINFECYWVGLDETKQSQMISEAKQRSEYIYDVEVSGKDKIITLSTCTYKFGAYGSPGQKNTRFVVQGKLLDNNNVNMKSFASLKKNPSPKQPVISQN